VSEQEELEKVQQRAIKMVAGLQGLTYDDKCKELGLETLEQRILQQDLMLAHKFIGGSIAGGENLFKKIDRPDGISTRRAMDPNSLETQYATDMRKFSFGGRVVNSWNRLDQDTKGCAEKGRFKAKIKFKIGTQ
jgi:ribonuclease P/MRP protein subunit RPP40